VQLALSAVLCQAIAACLLAPPITVRLFTASQVMIYMTELYSRWVNYSSIIEYNIQPTVLMIFYAVFLEIVCYENNVTSLKVGYKTKIM
jgi:hypothetical protein